MTIYTRRGDDGTTGLYGGERIRKDAPRIELVGTLDEAQALLGVARAECAAVPEIGGLLERVERDLWAVMADVAASPSARAAQSHRGVEQAMVERLEAEIDRFSARNESPREFAVPGESRLSAALDVARTVVRRAERVAVSVLGDEPVILAYLNRLSDLCWALARSVETERRTVHRDRRR